MRIHPIKSENDYQETLIEIEKLFDAKPNTPQGDKLDMLTTLVEAYEETEHAIELPDPITPNKETIAAMKAAREGKLVTVGNIDRLLQTLK